MERAAAECASPPSIMLPSRNPRLWLGCAAAIALAIVLRLVALKSDPFPGLDWDTGLMTDEGFYTHNARNVALFGHARLDEFNNMLVAPVVHWIQVGVFYIFGFGIIQARLISVVFSLLSLPI